MHDYDYQHESLDQKLHDVLALLSHVHGPLSYADPLLTVFVLRVTKHALAGIKEELGKSTDPKCSHFARIMAELRSGR
jgi:hypothetical protein